MDSQEQNIYNNLNLFGNYLGALFYDACLINQMNNLKTKSNILAHLCREIESGIWDILAVKEKSNDHKSKIANALNKDPSSDFIERFYNTSKKFHKYTHRGKVWGDPRDKNLLDSIWIEFKNLLELVLGDVNKILSKIDNIIARETYDSDWTERLKTLLKSDFIRNYFFLNLNSENWLQHLSKANYFSGSKNPRPLIDENEELISFPQWEIFNYLLKVSDLNKKNPKEHITCNLKNIIDEIVCYKDESGYRIENINTDTYLFLLILDIPNDFFEEKYFDYINLFLENKYGNNIEYRIEDLILKFKTSNSELILNSIFNIIFRYKIIQHGIAEEVESIFSHSRLNRVIDNNIEVIKKNKNICIEIISKNILEISLKVNLAFYTHSIPSLTNQSLAPIFDKYENQIIYLLVDLLKSVGIDHAKIFFDSHYNSKYSILRRVSLFLIGFYFKEDCLKYINLN